MIQIEEINISNFRGVRNLTLTPNRNSFGIYGPNGSGKSSVVDAIEFALTGKIRRFSGKGLGEVSVGQHASHIDVEDLKNAFVCLKVYMPRLGKSATITRNAKSRKPKIDPNETDVVELLGEASVHPEIALSRREISNLIITEPGARAKAILELLRLEGLEKKRTLLISADSTAKKELIDSKEKFDAAKSTLARHLDLRDPNDGQILDEINRRRSLLGISSFESVASVTFLLDGFADESEPTEIIEKRQALKKVDDFHSTLSDLLNEPALSEIQELLNKYDEPEVREAADRRKLIELGESLLAEDECPLCTNEIDEKVLRNQFQGTLAQMREASNLERSIFELAQVIADKIGPLQTELDLQLRSATNLNLSCEYETLADWKGRLKDILSSMHSAESVFLIRNDICPGKLAPSAVNQAIAKLKDALNNLPESLDADRAKLVLEFADPPFSNYRNCDFELQKAKATAGLAETVLNVYNDSIKTVLDSLYREVEQDFAQFYREINSDDESRFTVLFDHEANSVRLTVDFHQKGWFPASAYHSEGHQDGMGLCLYLALMKQLLKTNFQLVLLDDVIMSVDKHHRRKLCDVLKNNFPDTQFIVTTHDRTWFKQMQSAGLIARNSSVCFRNWSVADGPVVESVSSDWEEVDIALQKGDIPEAAARMRRLMEAHSIELANVLGAKVTYRADNDYHLGELLPAVIARFNKLLNQAADSARKWKDEEAEEKVQNLKNHTEKSNLNSKIDEWMVNKAVHYNSWTNFAIEDFRSVILSFKQLFKCFQCDRCCSWLELSYDKRHSPEVLNCDCGRISFNLVKPSREQTARIS